MSFDLTLTHIDVTGRFDNQGQSNGPLGPGVNIAVRDNPAYACSIGKNRQLPVIRRKVQIYIDKYIKYVFKKSQI